MDFHAIEGDLEEAIASCGCKLYDIELLRESQSLILRISIMKDSGVSLEDCALVSESISPLLDVKDVIKDAYMLEVSSPGIERTLKSPKHFMLSLGEAVQLRLHANAGGPPSTLGALCEQQQMRRELVGRLVQADERGIWLEAAGLDSSGLEIDSVQESLGSSVHKPLDGTSGVFIPYTAIKRARTIFQPPSPPKSKSQNPKPKS